MQGRCTRELMERHLRAEADIAFPARGLHNIVRELSVRLRAHRLRLTIGAGLQAVRSGDAGITLCGRCWRNSYSSAFHRRSPFSISALHLIFLWV